MPTEDHHINTLDDVKVHRLVLICMIINIVMVTKDVQPPEDTISVKKSQPSDHVS